MEATNTRWMNEAECKKYDRDIFFRDAKEERAKKICGRCPVKKKCLLYAMNIHPVDGVWGGTSLLDRAIMNRDEGELIKVTRKKLGWDQKELGRRAGVHGSVISRVERNVQVGSDETIAKIEKALGVPIRNRTVGYRGRYKSDKLAG